MARPAEELGTILEQGAWGTLAPAICSHPHAMLGAVSATCDLYAFGPDKLLRVFNAKATGSLRCSRLVLPQLLDESFVRRFPDFWQESPRVQADMVDEAHGGRPLIFVLSPPLETAVDIDRAVMCYGLWYRRSHSIVGVCCCSLALM